VERFAGRYLVERVLGEGGIGRVYLVSDPLAGGRRLALKHLRSQRVSAAIRAVMAREFRVLTRLRHPHLVEVYDFCLDPICYYTMEYAAGVDLLGAALGAGLAEAELFEAAVQLCAALEYVHAHGLVHLDVKPSNVLWGDGRVKLLDFGLASEAAARSGPGGYTPAFVAPEVIEGRSFDARADLYSLGRTLLALGEAGRSLPPWLAPIAERLARPDPAERFASAAQVAEALAQAAGRSVPGAAAGPPATVPPPPMAMAVQVPRAAELEHLLMRWRQAQRGEGQHVVVVGAAGTGKSWLARELKVQAQLEGGLVAVATCREGDRRFAAVVALVGQIAGVAAPLLAPRHLEVLAGLAVTTPSLEIPDAAPAGFGEALAGLVIAATTVQKVVLLVEDTEWLDEGSAALLRGLVGLEGVMLLETTSTPVGARGELVRLEGDGAAPQPSSRTFSTT
jgi:eukaryotic-like serine/threonine-protein kinase